MDAGVAADLERRPAADGAPVTAHQGAVSIDSADVLQAITTADGSPTFFSGRFQETFHSRAGALAESRQTFIDQAALDAWPRGHRLTVLDCCYGLGYNGAALWDALAEQRPDLGLCWLGLELDLSIAAAALEDGAFRCQWRPSVLQRLRAIASTSCWEESPAPGQAPSTGRLLAGDARRQLPLLQQLSGRVDVILHDPFSPPRCPELWTVECIGALARLLSPRGRLITYSRAAALRTALLQAGLQLGSIPPRHPRGWSDGSVASPAALPLGLSLMEREHLGTRAAVPYRDPCLSDSSGEILRRRAAEQRHSPLEATGAWRRRWRPWLEGRART